MTRSVTTTSTSLHTARIEEIELNRGQEVANPLTRHLIVGEAVENPTAPDRCLSLCIKYQRRRKKAVDAKDPWGDLQRLSLRDICCGEEVILTLNTSETLHLCQELQRLYKLAAGGVRLGTAKYVLADSEEENALAKLRALTDSEGLEPDQLLDLFEKLAPGVIRKVEMARQQAGRSQALDEFAKELGLGFWAEGEWEEFFRANKWIFGHGLAYQFLSEVQKQPVYGGTRVDGSGARKGDMLMATEATCKFTTLVEIKRPDAPLVSSKPYRESAYTPAKDVTGGVSQLLEQARVWVTEGARTDENRDLAASLGLLTCRPKMILVIGSLDGLDNPQLYAFENYRRTLHDVDIVTYDELLYRARYLLQAEAAPEAFPVPPREDMWRDGE